MELIDYKKKDREIILNYLDGKKVVSVDDIIANSKADTLRVYPILFEFEQEGKISVLERGTYGDPLKVTIIW